MASTRRRNENRAMNRRNIARKRLSGVGRLAHGSIHFGGLTFITDVEATFPHGCSVAIRESVSIFPDKKALKNYTSCCCNGEWSVAFSFVSRAQE